MGREIKVDRQTEAENEKHRDRQRQIQRPMKIEKKHRQVQ